MEFTFVADVHLGKLARVLRLLGFDTLYSNAFTTAELIKLALEQDRLLLSRSRAFSGSPGLTILVVQSEVLLEQLQQTVQHFCLTGHLRPFTRCTVCNGLLHPVAKETVQFLLQPNTYQYFTEFWQCAGCRQVYWKGSHYDRMLALVETVKQWKD